MADKRVAQDADAMLRVTWVRSTIGDSTRRDPRGVLPEVEIRDLAIYEGLLDAESRGIQIAAPLEIVDPEPTVGSRCSGNELTALRERILAEVGS